MGCASASWRCRRSIRCAAATDTHLRLLFSDLPEAMTVGAAATDTPAIGGWRQPRPRRRPVGVPVRRRTIGGAWRREGSSRSWHVARSSGSTPTGGLRLHPTRAGRGCVRARQRGAGQRAADLQEGQAVEFDIKQGRRGFRPPTCDHGRRTRRADPRLPPAAGCADSTDASSGFCLLVDATRAVGGPGSLGVIADDPRRMRIRTRPLHGDWMVGLEGAGGRDGDGRPEAAVRAAVTGLPGRPRPAPQLQGRQGVMPRLRPALAAG
jgi:hypothetical protein